MSTSAAHRQPNRLIHATSPYLLQHAHNPVDWYEWGPEALERAKREDKPIFLSIGYSACHWCHVMERESFESDEIAAVMNAHFVNIKVDREERPDLDDIYMTATQAMTRSGGWPMSVWLTPDQKPFYAGTYFPPDDRFGRPGFKRLLQFLADVWKDDRQKALQQADALTSAVVQLTSVESGDSIPPHSLIVDTAQMLARAFDSTKGGISGGGTNKFPPSMAMDLMLRAHHHALSAGSATPESRQLLELVELTLDQMACGGIYDQMGGGFARYSTDVDWLVPHFEKMLYDQALVSDIYLKAYQATRKPLYARIARETFDYAITDLQSPEGGFYSTRDADSEGVEGKFYVWTRAEIAAVLGEADSAIFCDYYDVSDGGNWEGHNILHVPRPAEVVAKLHRVTVEELDSRLAAARQKLLVAREARVKPHLDDKVLAGWNGLMIASLARGSRALAEPRYREAATRAADFVHQHLMRDGRLLRTCRNGTAHTPAFLDDHAFMIEGLLNIYEATFDLKWLDRAVGLNDALLKHFRDPQGGFFFAAADAEKTLVRSKDAGDGAVPSGNSVQVMNLLRLAVLLDRKDLEEEAQRSLRCFARQLAESPFRSERMLAALDFYHRRPREVAFVAFRRDVPRLEPLIEAAWRVYVPNLVCAGLVSDDPAAATIARRIPLLEGKKPLSEGPAAYVCRNFACKTPTGTPEKLLEELRP